MAKNRIMMVLSLVLCFAVSIGIAAAYFTDYEDARGGALLTLNGETETHEDIKDNKKIISVVNTGDTDVLVRVLVYGDTAFMDVSESGGTDWVYSEDESGDGVLVYYYSKVLAANDNHNASTSELSVTVSGRKGEADPVSYDITVVHESVRAVYTQDAKGNNVVAAPEGWAGMPAIEAE